MGEDKSLGGYPVKKRFHYLFLALLLVLLISLGFLGNSEILVQSGPPQLVLLTNVDTRHGDHPSFPKSVRYSPDGRFVILPCMSGNELLVLDGGNGSFVKRAPLVERTKHAMPVETAFSKDGNTAYIQTLEDGDLVVFDMTSMTQVSLRTNVGEWPKIIEFNPDYSRLFVSEWCGHRIAVLNPTNLELVTRIATPPTPRGMCFSTNGRTVWVACFDEKRREDGEHGYIAEIDLRKKNITWSTDTRGSPRSMILSKDEKSLFVSDMALNRIFVVDTESRKIVDEIEVSGRPKTMAITEDEEYLFVACYSGGVIEIIDVESRSVISTVSADSNATGLALSPDGTRLWSANMESDTAMLWEVRRKWKLAIPGNLSF